MPLHAHKRFLETTRPPVVHVRGRSFMALALTPEPPLAAWFAALDEHLHSASGLFAERPVVVDLSRAAEEGRDAVLILLDGLETRGLRIIGLEGAAPGLLTATHWEKLPTQLYGRDVKAPPAERAAAPRPDAMLIEGPVRSGQSVVFEAGDLTIVGAVASGAEVIAGGSIHVYGALRGRAIAGCNGNPRAQIFCRKLDPELLAIDGYYKTADDMDAQYRGRAAQVRLDGDAIVMEALS